MAFFLCPKLTVDEQRILAQGGRLDGKSITWFEHGGVGVDDEGLYLVDADAVRHPIQDLPEDAQMVRITQDLSGMGITSAVKYSVWISDSRRRKLVLFPSGGWWEEPEGWQMLAGLAHLEWVDFRTRHPRDYNAYKRTRGTLDLRSACLAKADYFWWQRLLRRASDRLS